MKIHQVKQLSDEWFLLKFGRITGTRVKDLMLKSKEIEDSALYFKILSEHTHKYAESDSFSNIHTERGLENEPKARSLLSNIKGLDFNELGFIEFDEYSGLSPDGFTEDLKFACEIKCPAPETFERYVKHNSRYPDLTYSWQLVNYFMVNTLEKLYYTTYSDEHLFNPVQIIELNIDSELNVGTEKKPVLKPISELLEQYKAKKAEFVGLIEAKLKEYKSNLEF